MGYADYWVYVKKDDNVFVQERRPRGKFYVHENSEEVRMQHRWHWFNLYNKEHKLIRSCDLETRCGYDRGPKLRNLIRNLIINGMAGKYDKPTN